MDPARNTLKMLFIEDSRDDLDLILDTIRRGGFEPEYHQVQSANELNKSLSDDWNIIISDFDLPGFNGFEALRMVREKKADIPFIMVSGTIGEELAVEAMRAGAHDYMMKDNLRRLVPAIQRELKEQAKRKELKRELAEHEELLKQAQKMEAIGRLAGGIAHDFNNLLAVLLMAAENLQNKIPKDHAAREDLAQIQTAIERAAALTKQLLAFSRKQVSNPQSVDMNSMVTQTQAMLQRLLGEKFKFNMNLQKDLPKICMDPVQFEQVLMNLIVNARDAMPNGGEISIATSEIMLDRVPEVVPPKPKKYTVLTVRDTGVGMDEETKKKIFEPFFTTKDPGRGTGLGLSTVFGIVRQSGGHIDVESTPGKGTEFRILLPIDETVPTAATAASAQPVSVSKAPAKGATSITVGRDVQAGSETILLVEDQEELRRSMKEVLRNSGYNVLSAESARDAIRIESETKETIDILVTDLIMPERNGFELAQLLKKRRPGLQVLIMSGFLDSRLIETKGEVFHQHFLHKPFSSSELTKKIRKILDKSKSKSASS
ncbi:MAG: response regulator [Bdellovibrionia bacterium]